MSLELDERLLLDDRLIASFSARHFHIELHDVLLEGGGHVDGRVHRDRPWPGGNLAVTVRCVEAWLRLRPRTTLVSTRGSALPRWREACIWEASEQLDDLEDATWRGFSFRLPDDLPVAVEARTLAWRYEIEARRIGRLRLAERAVETPLRYRALLVPSGR